MRKPILFLLVLCLPLFGHAQVDFLLKPDRVFDGKTMHEKLGGDCLGE